MFTIKEGLSYDDVLLEPKYSPLTSRSEVNVSVKYKDFTFSHPIVPSNMKTIVDSKMIKATLAAGGLSILHRFMPIDEQIEMVKQTLTIQDANKHFAVSVGVQAIDKENIKKFVELGIKIICIDVAHGHSKLCMEMTSWIRKNYPNILIIAGNVATVSGARALWTAGADIIKCGVEQYVLVEQRT